MAADLPSQGQSRKQLAVLAAAGPQQRIADGLFARSLLRAWDDLEDDPRWAGHKHIPLKTLATRTATLVRAEAPQVAVSPTDQSIGIDWFRNRAWAPQFEPALAELADWAVTQAHDQVRRTSGLTSSDVDTLVRKTIQDHFEPKSRGLGSEGDTDSDVDRFVGRERAVDAVRRWLHGEGNGLAVVAGQAGAGKSAVLGQALRGEPQSDPGLITVWARRLSPAASRAARHS